MHILPIILFTAAMVSTAAAESIDDYVKSQMTARRLPGLSLAVVRHGRIVKAGGYGVASLELRTAATAGTVYEIGSISKQFAADAVLLLAEDHKLQLDDPIAKYVDGTPPAWSAITIRRILTHTAGLADFDTGNIGFSYRREYTAAEFVALMAAQPLTYPPGEQWAYTNAFPLLGMVVERAAGVPYTTFVENRIFKPLGLASARFKIAGDVVLNRADGYMLVDGAYRHGETLRPAVIAANGGIMMNVVDFARWDIAMTSGRLLGAESIKAMTTPVRLNDGRTVSHGLGWFMDRFNGHPFGAHWGTTVAGHSAVIRRYVNDSVTVIVMSNLNDDGLAVDAISKRIADRYVPGVDVHGLRPVADQQKDEWARLRTTLEAVAAGAETNQAPGLGTRLPPRVRQRIADTLRTATSVDYLGEEPVGATHFNLDPAVVAFRRYRAVTPAGMRYFTLRLSASGTLQGVLIEN
ncbi:MAG: serine hydrolase domain-containing protein [Vicinamibacterales bacterium]